MIDDLDRITAAALAHAARGDLLPPRAIRFLLLQYASTGRDEVSDAVGHALALALDRHAADESTFARADWLRVFIDAAAMADDPRLTDASRTLAGRIADGWPSTASIDETAAAIEAYLLAAHVDPQAAIPPAIDELERIVAQTYQPGRGLARAGVASDRGRFIDHVRVASLLLTAFEVTGRLPYAMLAEELMQYLGHAPAAEVDVVAASEAAIVLLRLAALHDDDDYRGAAVIAPGADYHADAERVLAAIHGLDAAPLDAAATYGLARALWRTTPRGRA